MARRSIEILSNAIFWVASAWLLVSGFSVLSVEHAIENGVETKTIQRDSMMMVQIAIVIASSFILFYFNLYVLNFKLARGISGKSVVLSLGAYLLVVVLYAALILGRLIPLFPIVPASLVVGIITFYYAVSVAYGLAISWFRSEADRKNLIIEKNSAELSLLRNQLQPHFLFNALNNLLAMLHQKQYAGATESIEKLAHLLRYVIEETKEETVTLAQEIEFLKSYTSLQMLRFDTDEVALHFSVEGDVENFSVEPGIFLPFIENAFKYGAEPETQSRIAISFKVSGTEIHFSVSNPILKSMHKVGTGIGITSTKNRLNLVYPNRHHLTIENNQEFTVHLKLFL